MKFSYALFLALAALAASGCCRCVSLLSSGSGSGPEPPESASVAPPVPLASSKPNRKAAALSYLDFQPNARDPLHGAWVRDELHEERFEPHQATGVAAFGDQVVVQANTGLWLCDGATLERKERIAAPPIDAVATYKDLIAYASGKDLVILGADRKPRSRKPIDEARRIRFSPDGTRIVVASHRRDSVMLLEVDSNKRWRSDADEAVNDAIILPEAGNIVAWADNGDRCVMQPISGAGPRFDARPRSGVFSRDQNAVAYDARTDMFFCGGDDNDVWRYEKAHDARNALPGVELKGNVEEILLTHAPAAGKKGGAVVVALDNLEVDLLDADTGEITASVGPLAGPAFRHAIRIDLTAEDDVLASMEGVLLRFTPSTAAMVPSRQFSSTPVDWRLVSGPADALLIAPSPGHEGHSVVQRAARSIAPDVAMTIAGEVEITGGYPAPLSSGSWVIVARAPNQRARLVYLGKEGAPEAPLDFDASMACSPNGLFPCAVAERPDHGSVAVLDGAGTIFEVTDTPRGMTAIGRIKGTPEAPVSLSWDAATKHWRARDARREAIAIDAP